ncbi:MAG: hypothetical protein QW379_06850 [Thermoplasmata archaeon]
MRRGMGGRWAAWKEGGVRSGALTVIEGGKETMEGRVEVETGVRAHG